jgi:hypothetical protein
VSKAENSVFESSLKIDREKSWVSARRKKNPEKQPENSGTYTHTEQQREVNWN